MKTLTLKDKVLEVYLKKENPDERSIKRSIERYLRKPCSERKSERILNDLRSRFDIDKEVRQARSRENLSKYIDSIIIGRIRDAYKNSREFNIDELEELEFKSLVKKVVLHFGYEELYVPLIKKDAVDFIVHRSNIKVAVFAVKADKGCNVGVKFVRQARYIANDFHCEKAILFSSTSFDKDAVEESGEIGVTLIGFEKFLPMVHDFINELKKTERELLVEDNNDENNKIFLDCIIKTPKTKVQIVNVKYVVQEVNEKEIIVFEGKLLNTGKRPVENLSINIRIFDRAGMCQYEKSVEAAQKLESKEKCPFSIYFDEIPQEDWKNLCRYEIKLEYKNIYAKR
ncbi:MAG TPA: restriction endonuclease [Clostridiaceae bacterium]|nr:restriction endonuclease [Clostridiaceae bacterium]